MMLAAAFFTRPAPTVAKALLGQELCHTLPNGTVLSGIIVEAEAYLFANDPASHHARGTTHATRALRMAPGTLYVHPMRQYVGLDIVTLEGAVLIRALQPRQGFSSPPPHTLANGPGKLCRALGITKDHYGLNLTHADCPVHILSHPRIPPKSILTTPRIGITKNTDAPLRFVLKNSLYASR